METASTEEKFHHAVELIKNLPKSGSFQPTNELKLKFYSYYKQATEGPCDLPKPGFWDLVSRAKWDAWMRLGDLPKKEAMDLYVDEFVQILKTTPFDENAHNYVDLMGPFMDLAPKEFREQHMHLNGSAVVDTKSMPVKEEILGKNYKLLKPIKNVPSDSCDDGKKGDAGKTTKINGHNMNGTTESDSDQFSDTFYDQVGGESENELVSSPTFVGFGNSVTSIKGSITEARGGGDQRVHSRDISHPLPGSSSSRGNNSNRRGRNGDFSHHSHFSHSSFVGGGGGGKRNSNHGTTPESGDLSEQLAFAVIRLQYTMEQVVSRLDSLETLLQENKANSCIGVSKMRNIFTSIFGIPPSAVLIMFAWPFIAQWLIYVIQKRRRR